jgi:hypothetical protein
MNRQVSRAHSPLKGELKVLGVKLGEPEANQHREVMAQRKLSPCAISI